MSESTPARKHFQQLAPDRDCQECRPRRAAYHRYASEIPAMPAGAPQEVKHSNAAGARVSITHQPFSSTSQRTIKHTQCHRVKTIAIGEIWSRLRLSTTIVHHFVRAQLVKVLIACRPSLLSLQTAHAQAR